MDRRSFLRTGAGGAVAAAVLAGTSWREALATTVGPGYGPLSAPDVNGVRLPPGFSSRVIARSGQTVPGTDYVWHWAPDGGATIPSGTGGWYYVSNAEIDGGGGGASAIRFSSRGAVQVATRILSGTSRNCSGGATPWKTWLSCEEISRGLVWETFPKGGAAVARPALGAFEHEAAAIDPGRGVVYLTEDKPDAGFYRFTPAAYPSLAAGRLDIAVGGGGSVPVQWMQVPDPAATATSTRYQVAGARRFKGGEGCSYSDLDDSCYFTTKGDNRVWRYRCDSGFLQVFYEPGQVAPATSPLTGVDNVTVSRTRDVFVAEDGGDLEICVISAAKEVSPFLRMVGHSGSELTGVAFSPDGGRLYFSSQRGVDGRGITYEVRGPFR